MRPSSKTRLTPSGLLLALVVACGTPTEPKLESIPHPALEGADPSVRELLASERVRLEDLAGASEDPALLGLGYGLMGRLYQSHDFVAAAAACFRNAVQLEPADARWHYHLGMVYQQRRRYDLAQIELDSALQEGSERAPTLWRLGDIARSSGKTGEALANYRRAVEADPECHGATLGIAEAERDLGNLEAAVVAYRNVLSHRPDIRRAHYGLAQILLRLDRRAEAEPHFEHARPDTSALPVATASLCPDTLAEELLLLTTGAPVHFTRALMAARDGNTELELEELRKAVASAPELPSALQALAIALAREGELQEASELYEKASQVQPDNASNFADLGFIFNALGKTDEAASALEQALVLEPDRRQARLQLGNIRFRQGRPTESLAAADVLLRADARDAEAEVLRAASLITLGRGQEGLAGLRKMLDENPPDAAELRVLAATVIASLGDTRRALQHLEFVGRTEVGPIAQRARQLAQNLRAR